MGLGATDGKAVEGKLSTPTGLRQLILLLLQLLLLLLILQSPEADMAAAVKKADELAAFTADAKDGIHAKSAIGEAQEAFDSGSFLRVSLAAKRWVGGVWIVEVVGGEVFREV